MNMGMLEIPDSHNNSRKTLVKVSKASVTAAQRANSTLGLYSAFLACRAIVFKSKRQSRLTVATMFLLRKRC